MELLKEISAAEDLYRGKLESYLNSILKDTILNSHGLEHHSRVWKNARDLLLHPGIATDVAESNLPLKLLIASFLHDSGMAIEKGPRHGTMSRQFCEKFLAVNGFSPGSFTDMLEAVENHDNKDNPPAGRNNLLADLLMAADDLDALGYTGIYRYLEIYIIRSVPPEEIGNRIVSNVNARFKNLDRIFRDFPSVVSRFRPKLEIVTGFFEKYNIQVKNYRHGTGHPSGYCGVAEILEMMILNRAGLEETIDSSIENPDRVISWYFGELKREIYLM